MLRIIIVLLLLFFPGVYFLYTSSKDRVIDDLIAASHAHDSTAFSSRIDWDKTRGFTKNDLKSKKRALGAYGSMIGPDISKIDAIVDYYVQADNVPLAFYMHDLYFENVPVQAFIHDSGFAPPYGFYITLGYPVTDLPVQAIAPELRERMKVKLVFRLDGLTWKISEMHVPVFMIPFHAYSIPARDYFGVPDSYK